ncbi:MAG TPA: hypothetical protein VNO30_21125 [Kofleriaceae bacterium]|nr:hypothetical protein [Kofleriaceae bacterium]
MDGPVIFRGRRDRRPKVKLRQPFAPTKAWLDAFEEQATQSGFEQRLKRYATMCARKVATAGRHVDDFYHRELIQDAIHDTLTGTRAWNPEHCELEIHLCGVIQSRTHQHFVQSTRFKPERLDPDLANEVEEALATARDDSSLAEERSALAQRILDDLRALTAEDQELQQLLTAYERGATKKVEVLQVTRMSSKTYDAARKRLLRLIQQLPADTREAARAYA